MRTFAQALPADAAQRIRNLNRRRRYHQTLDRPKVWPGNYDWPLPLGLPPA